jgi:hypothetical protein
MLELTNPWALALLPLPLLMRLLPAYKESRDSVRVPFFDKLVELSQQRPDTGAMILRRDRAQRFLVNFMWLCLVLSAAKPQGFYPAGRHHRRPPAGGQGSSRGTGEPARLGPPGADCVRQCSLPANAFYR